MGAGGGGNWDGSGKGGGAQRDWGGGFLRGGLFGSGGASAPMPPRRSAQCKCPSGISVLRCPAPGGLERGADQRAGAAQHRFTGGQHLRVRAHGAGQAPQQRSGLPGSGRRSRGDVRAAGPRMHHAGSPRRPGRRRAGSGDELAGRAAADHDQASGLRMAERPLSGGRGGCCRRGRDPAFGGKVGGADGSWSGKRELPAHGAPGPGPARERWELAEHALTVKRRRLAAGRFCAIQGEESWAAGGPGARLDGAGAGS